MHKVSEHLADPIRVYLDNREVSHPCDKSDVFLFRKSGHESDCFIDGFMQICFSERKFQSCSLDTRNLKEIFDDFIESFCVTKYDGQAFFLLLCQWSEIFLL